VLGVHAAPQQVAAEDVGEALPESLRAGHAVVGDHVGAGAAAGRYARFEQVEHEAVLGDAQPDVPVGTVGGPGMVAPADVLVRVGGHRRGGEERLRAGGQVGGVGHAADGSRDRRT
jgi:hypothetical protein